MHYKVIERNNRHYLLLGENYDTKTTTYYWSNKHCVLSIFKKKQTPGRREKETEEKPQAVSELVECTHCGVYIEIEETLLSGTKYYCSRECLNAKV